MIVTSEITKDGEKTKAKSVSSNAAVLNGLSYSFTVSSEHVQHLFRLDDKRAPSRLPLPFLIHMQIETHQDKRKRMRR